MYVASFRENPSSSPVITVLVIRGTDISTGPDAVMGQIFEDTGDWTRVNWRTVSAGENPPCDPDDLI